MLDAVALGPGCRLLPSDADSAVVMTHLATLGEEYAERFMQVLKPVRFVVQGSPSAEAKEALTAFSPVYMAPVAGFSR